MAEEPSHIKQLSLIHVCKIGLRSTNTTCPAPLLDSLWWRSHARPQLDICQVGSGNIYLHIYRDQARDSKYYRNSTCTLLQQSTAHYDTECLFLIKFETEIKSDWLQRDIPFQGKKWMLENQKSNINKVLEVLSWLKQEKERVISLCVSLNILYWLRKTCLEEKKLPRAWPTTLLEKETCGKFAIALWKGSGIKFPYEENFPLV